MDELKTDQEPVAWCFRKALVQKIQWRKPTGGDDVLRHWEPLYTHPAPVVSSEPVFQVGFGWLKHDHVENGTLLYTAPPSPEECTNSDRWNCKYCGKTSACSALADQRNHKEPPSRHLSDEEIIDLWDTTDGDDRNAAIEFARAILEKAK